MLVGGRNNSEDQPKGWHEAVKTELKRLIPGIELEKRYRLGEKQSWGDLGRYQPDGTLDVNGRATFFEIEVGLEFDKVVGDMIQARMLNAERLVFIFSNRADVWNGETRVKAALYIAQVMADLVTRPLSVKALYIDGPKNLGEKLRETGIP